jgi:plastocyanin
MSKRSLLSLTLVVMFIATGLMLSLSPCLADQKSSPTNTLTASILIQSFVFSPSSITVAKGTTVTWTNADRMTYKIKSDSFESGSLDRGDEFSHTFNETGTYNYAEASNPAMKGTIIVT